MHFTTLIPCRKEFPCGLYEGEELEIEVEFEIVSTNFQIPDRHDRGSVSRREKYTVISEVTWRDKDGKYISLLSKLDKGEREALESQAFYHADNQGLMR